MKLTVIAIRRRSQQGSSLMLVFGLIAMLTYLVFSTFRVVVSDVEFSIARKKGFRCRYLAESGLNLAMNPAVQRWDRALLNQTFGEDGYEKFETRIRGEGGKININTIILAARDDNKFVSDVFLRLGVTDDDMRRDLIARMVDWVDADDAYVENGMEKEQYEKLGIFGYPFDRPFYNLDEVLLVPGFEAIAQARPNWRDIFTIYSQGKIDLNEASALVISVATGVSEEDAQKLVESRWGDDKSEDTEDDANAKIQDVTQGLYLAGVPQADAETLSAYFTTNDTTTRIESVGTVGDFRKRIVMVVNSRQGNTPQILMREEIPLF
jgi:hypothetical protein